MDGWMSFVQNEQSIKQSIKMIIKVVRVVVIVNCDYPPSHTHTNKHTHIDCYQTLAHIKQCVASVSSKRISLADRINSKGKH